MIHTTYYRGARIEVSQVGLEWQARVFLPGTISPHRFVPRASGPKGQETVVDQAKQLVNEVDRDDEIA
jgi:hypothetical protein